MLLAALLAWLWLRVPYLINPWAVFAHLSSGTLPESTANLMVAMLPIVVLALFTLAVAIVLLLFAALANERRMIGLVRGLTKTARLGE